MKHSSLNYFKYCPVCAAKFGLKKHDHVDRLVCSRCNFIFYQNSKPTVSAFIVNNKKQLLLVKRGVEPKLGYWDTPGGFLEEGENPLKGLKREIKEELGVTLKDIRLFGAYNDSYFERYSIKTLNLAYCSQIASGKISSMDDVIGFEWFDLSKIPLPRIAFKWIREALKDWMA